MGSSSYLRCFQTPDDGQQLVGDGSGGGTDVFVGFGVLVGFGLGFFGFFVGLGVLVTVGVGVIVGVSVAVGVNVAVGVSVGVGVAVGLYAIVIQSECCVRYSDRMRAYRGYVRLPGAYTCS